MLHWGRDILILHQRGLGGSVALGLANIGCGDVVFGGLAVMVGQAQRPAIFRPLQVSLKASTWRQIPSLLYIPNISQLHLLLQRLCRSMMD